MLRPDHAEDWSRTLRTVRHAAAAGQYVLVYHHFQGLGTERWRERFAKACIDAGAIAYIAHGAPRLLGIEVYKQRPILYGLGNFVFQTRTPIGHYDADVWQSVIADLRFEGTSVTSIELIPIVIDEGKAGPMFLKRRGYPSLATGETARYILTQVAGKSVRHGTKIRIEKGRGDVVIPE